MYFDHGKPLPSPLCIDLGAGKNPREGYLAVDVIPGSDLCVDLVDGMRWPFSDESVDALSSSHFIEHIPADSIITEHSPIPKDRLFFFFDECYRVAKPGALFGLVWPSLKSSDAFRDPTHRRFLPLEFTHYLSREGRASMRVESYNVFCDWRVIETKLHTSPSGDTPFTQAEIDRDWDVQKAWSVTLRKNP